MGNNRSSQQSATEAVSNKSSQRHRQSAREAISKERSRAEKRECNPSISFPSSPWHLPPLSNRSFQLKEQKSIFQWKRRETEPDFSSAWSATRGPASMESLMPTQTTPPSSTIST